MFRKARFLIQSLLFIFILTSTKVSASGPVWITHPTANLTEHGVYLFRKTFDLTEVPGSFVIEVSADPRYRLFVNGEAVCFGPAKSDVPNWRYETVDIAGYLIPGTNSLAAWVYNRGSDRPVPEVSAKTAFYLSPGDSNTAEIASDETWKVTRAEGYGQITSNDMKWWGWAAGWYAMGSTHNIDGSKIPWGWEETDYDDSGWSAALALTPAGSPWKLNPRPIPMLEETEMRINSVDRSSGVTIPAGFPAGNDSVVIPPNSSASILFDQEELTIGYPELTVSKGEGSEIRVTYAEALFISKEVKDRRDRVDGMFIDGYYDIFRPEGGYKRLYRPLWFRTYRYVQFDIQTGDEELVLNSYKTIFTAYPFTREATLDLNSKTVDTMMNIGWRTARLCAAETYFDCPYYEQLNYGGDSRVQAHLTLYLSGDDRLMKDAIRHMIHSTTEEGITKACYPMKPEQNIDIPPYSLFTISMIHDYFMHREDSLFLAKTIPNIKSILTWFEGFLNTDNMLQDVTHWNFVDWAFDHGTPPGAEGSGTQISSILTLQLAMTYDEAADLMDYFGDSELADQYLLKASLLKEAVYTKCYKSGAGLFTDTPAQNTYSQHANIFAILADAIPEEEQAALMEKIIARERNMVEAKPYFKFYLFKALTKTGLGDEFMNLLYDWEKQVDYGLTTFTEEADLKHDRSDCHAWTAHPLYYFFYTVCGIQPDAPAFRKVKIAPNPGDFPELHASIPHPSGTLTVDLAVTDSTMEGSVELPSGITGRFVYFGQQLELREGQNEIDIKKSTVSSLENKRELILSVFPNPARDKLFVNFREGELRCGRLELTDMTGRSILIRDKTEALNELDLSRLANGLYILRYISDLSSTTARIIRIAK